MSNQNTTAFDFSKEEEQKEFGARGPVPAGSIIIAQLSILTPNSKAPDNPNICVAKSGLRQLYCGFEVVKGSYQGVAWRQTITLPLGMQAIRLTEGQTKSCKIGGATLRAILEACQIPMAVKNIMAFNGLTFPCRVKINPTPNEANGKTYWNNELASVITPKMKLYIQVLQQGEIINEEGQVTGIPNKNDQQPNQPPANAYFQAPNANPNYYDNSAAFGYPPNGQGKIQNTEDFASGASAADDVPF